MLPKSNKNQMSSQKYSHQQDSSSNFEESDFVMNSQDQSSEYQAEESQLRPQATGRHETNQHERQRRAQKAKPNVALEQVYHAKSVGEMAISKKLYDGLEHWELLEFLEGYNPFVLIIKLQMEDRHPNWDIETIQRFDFKNDFLYEPIPRSFKCGLMRLEEHKRVERQPCFQVTEAEIKAIYISTLLLINIGEIPKKEKIQKASQSDERYFTRIVTYLIDNSKFLSPKLFYQISSNWAKTIQMIREQFEADQNNERKPVRNPQSRQSFNSKFSDLRIQEKPQNPVCNYETTDDFLQKAEIQINQISQDDAFEDQFYENQKSSRKREGDFQDKFLSGSKQKHEEKGILNLPVKPQKKVETFKRSAPVMEEKGEIKTKKKVKLDSSDPDVQKAILYYNFCQSNTRDRSGKGSKKQKKPKVTNQKPQKALNQQKSSRMKEEKMVQEEKAKMDYEEDPFSMIDDEFENLFGGEYQHNYSIKRKDSISSIDHIFMDVLVEEIDQIEEEKMNNEEDEISENDPHEVTEDEPVIQSQSSEEPEEGNNPNRKVKHQKREIDYMINAILKDRFVMMQSIACEIYHSLKAMKASVQWDDCRGYRRNLTRMFEQ